MCILVLLKKHQVSHRPVIADQVTNLREEILTYRLRYSLTSMADEQGEELLNKAAKAMEK